MPALIGDEKLSLPTRVALGAGSLILIPVSALIVFSPGTGWWLRAPLALVGVAGLALLFLALVGRKSPLALAVLEAAGVAIGMS